MQNSATFVNWLEGFLDGCGNTPSPKQMKEIRKRLSEISNSTNEMIPMWETNKMGTVTLTQPLSQKFGKNPEANEEFLQAIEESKNASTMEELFES
jgi:hypothetical protein